ncbi:hypothetical protein LB565_20195 [Mesorhizobium sp. CA14]|uniref:hypothetical protein n=1 Tax=Mesorhizobium sp. CA14 TaxID=2876642 RepID=UPI001CCBE45B|nr:hypothetical protein [Mesorhizobium sp. CA14]MBZ9850305.1 hypothetical protein [Mesorhizobium sp. CA14]
MNVENTVSPAMVRDLITGYTEMVESRVFWGGWEPTLLTFMFNQLKGSENNVAFQMQDAVEAIYANILNWCFRKPRNVPTLAMPLWICTPDYPVYKRNKDSLRVITPNNGRHVHAIALTPPGTRMKDTLDSHFDEQQRRYAGRDRPLSCIDTRPIRDHLKLVTDYAPKGIKNPRIGPDGMFVLPRTHSEMEGRRAEKAYLSDLA